MPRYERAELPSWYADDEWRLRVGGSNPADEDFLQALPPATETLAHNYVDPEGEAWLVTYPRTSSTARAHARWQWFVLQLITDYTHWPSWDYVSRFIAAVHNPLRP